MKGKYKRKKVWCSSCDMQIVELGKKCITCGKRQHCSKNKKPSSKKIINDEKEV